MSVYTRHAAAGSDGPSAFKGPSGAFGYRTIGDAASSADRVVGAGAGGGVGGRSPPEMPLADGPASPRISDARSPRMPRSRRV